MFIAMNNRDEARNDLSVKDVVVNNDDDGILIYSVPAEGDVFRISGINTLKLKSMEVFDMSGNLVGEIDKQQLDENGEISAEHFNSGTYVLSIIFADYTITRTIIIE